MPRPQSFLVFDVLQGIFCFFLLTFNFSPAFTICESSVLHEGQYLFDNRNTYEKFWKSCATLPIIVWNLFQRGIQAFNVETHFALVAQNYSVPVLFTRAFVTPAFSAQFVGIVFTFFTVIRVLSLKSTKILGWFLRVFSSISEQYIIKNSMEGLLLICLKSVHQKMVQVIYINPVFSFFSLLALITIN